jgi:hypothetical protein
VLGTSARSPDHGAREEGEGREDGGMVRVDEPEIAGVAARALVVEVVILAIIGLWRHGLVTAWS